jgi:hypothetical protein
MASSALDEAIQIARSCEDLIIRKIPRSDNAVAHALAAYSRTQMYPGVMNHSAPSCVLELVMRECNQNFTV